MAHGKVQEIYCLTRNLIIKLVKLVTSSGLVLAKVRIGHLVNVQEQTSGVNAKVVCALAWCREAQECTNIKKLLPQAQGKLVGF